MKSRIRVGLTFGLLAVLLIGCQKDFVTGNSTFSMLSESQEVELGRSSHEAVIEEYGLYDDPNWQKYIDAVGQEVAKVSHRPNLEYHFYVVDSPVVNAFALPGGWVYFTRGILAHFNSEDEMAGVMGHEIGHVVARHGAEQYTRQQLAGLTLGVASAVSEKFRPYAGLASTGLGLLFLKFSRSQESESDKLGVQYTTRIGYDSHKMAGFFRTISRISEGAGQSTPNFLSTHPNPLNREARVHELTDEVRAKDGFTPRNTDQAAFLRRIDGMVFGPDPRQGYFDESKHAFYHPNWGIEFPVPDGWKFQRGGSAFQMVNGDETAVLVLSKQKENLKPEDVAAKFLSDTKAAKKDQRNVTLSGFRGLAVASTISDETESLGLLSYFVSNGKDLYVGHGFCAEKDFAKYRGTFGDVLNKFSKLTNREAMNKKPERLVLKKAPKTGSLESNLSALGVKQERQAELAILNGMALSDQVNVGGWIKIVQ